MFFQLLCSSKPWLLCSYKWFFPGFSAAISCVYSWSLTLGKLYSYELVTDLGEIVQLWPGHWSWGNCTAMTRPLTLRKLYSYELVTDLGKIVQLWPGHWPWGNCTAMTRSMTLRKLYSYELVTDLEETVQLWTGHWPWGNCTAMNCILTSMQFIAVQLALGFNSSKLNIFQFVLQYLLLHFPGCLRL